MRKYFAALLTVSVCALFFVSSIGMSSVLAQVTYPVPREEAWVMVWGTFTIFDSFNVFIPNGVQWGSGWHQLCVEWMWTVDIYTNQTLYWLVTGWEYNDDYTEFALNLREGVKWNDGVPFTANDVAFSINYGINNSVGAYRFFGEFVERMEVPDDHTLVLYLNSPRPKLHLSFGMGVSQGKALSIIPEHIWKDKDVLTFKNSPPVGTGPYLLYKVLPQAEMFIWVRDEDWWAIDVLGLYPAAKYVISKTGEAPDIAIPQMIRGDIDYGPSLRGPLLAETVSSATTDYAVIDNIECGSFGFYINCDPSNYPLNLTEFRRAVSYCIKKERVAELYPTAEQGVPAEFAWPAFWPGTERFADQDLLDEYGVTYDPGKAAEILDGLDFIDRNGDGWRDTPDGVKISIEIIDPGPDVGFDLMSVDLAEELKKIGIDATERTVATLWDIMRVGDYDIAAAGIWESITGGDLFYLLDHCQSKYYTPIGETSGWEISGLTRYYNPELDPIVEQSAALALDDPELDTLYHDGLAIIMRDLPVVPVLLPYNQWVVSTKYWTGYPETFTIIAPHWTIAEMLYHLESTVAPPVVTYVTAYITGDVAAFKGVDGEMYGPYESGEAAFIPKEDADRLIAAGLASLVPAELPMIAEAISELASDVAGLKTDVADVKSDIQDLSSNTGSMSTLTYASIGLNVIVLILVAVLLVRKRS